MISGERKCGQAYERLTTLTNSETFLLKWLGQEDNGGLYGECHGRDLDVLVDLGLAQIGPTPAGRDHNYSRATLTEDGIARLVALRSQPEPTGR